MEMKIITTVGMILLVVICLMVPANLFAAPREGKKSLLSLGSPAPDFKLRDVVSGKMISRDDLAEKKALLVIFLCRHCPYVQHVKTGIVQMAKDYAGKGVGIVAISSNDPAGYPEDAPEKLKEMAVTGGFPMPLLFDETQEVAKAYTAVATPDLFLFDKDRKLVYRGQFDDARPRNTIPVTGKDIRAALDAVLEGKSVPSEQKPAIGCSIKWKQ